MTRMDDLLRRTIAEMTSEVHAPSAALARDAMAKGGRIRRHRQFAVVAGAVAAIAALALAQLVVGRPEGSSPPVVADKRTITEVPTPLAGGWLVNSAGGLYLHRASLTYVSFPSTDPTRLLRAPVGDRLAVVGGDEPIVFADVRGGDKLTVTDPQRLRVVQWAPTGDRLVGQIMGGDKNGLTLGFGVIDSATGKMSKHWIDLKTYNCSQCRFGWSRDGREIVMAIANRARGENAELVESLQFFDAVTGQPTRSVPVRAWPSSPFSWSPDGRYVIANPDVLQGQFQLIEVATGKAAPFPHDAVWATNELLLVEEGASALTLRRDGSTVETATLGGAFSGMSGVSLGPPD